MNNDEKTVEELVNRNMPLCHWFKRKYRDTDPDEALSLAMDGLLRAAQSWDPDKGNFGTWASILIEQRFAGYWDRMTMIKRGGEATHYHLDAPMTWHGDARVAPKFVSDMIPDESQRRPDQAAEAAADVAEITSRAFAVLAPRDRWMLTEHFGLHGGESRTMTDIGVEIGVSRERVRQLVKRAMADMRRAAEHIFAGRAPQVPVRQRARQRKVRRQRWRSSAPGLRMAA